MTVEQLLRLYPRAWRERYGNEFADLVGARQLTMQQTFDIAVGAIDAWISPSVRASVRGATAGTKTRGDVMIQQLKLKVCATATPRYTTRDGYRRRRHAARHIRALGRQHLGIEIRSPRCRRSAQRHRSRRDDAVHALLAHGTSRLATTIIVGGTTVFLVLIGLLSTRSRPS